MLNTLFGMYIHNIYNARSDRILWMESVTPSGTVELSITDAVNGAALKANLAGYDYIITKYTTWTTNGIVQIEINPDAEPINQLKTYSLTQKTEAMLIPPKQVLSDISLKLVNLEDIPDDVTIILEIIKVPEGKIPQLVDLINSIVISPGDIDIQTLAIEKYLTRTNQLLEALLLANNGTIIPNNNSSISSSNIQEPSRCKRI